MRSADEYAALAEAHAEAALEILDGNRVSSADSVSGRVGAAQVYAALATAAVLHGRAITVEVAEV